MLKKIISLFVALAIFVFPLQANAEGLDGRVTSLAINEEAPFAGVLLDSVAASKMIVDQKYLRMEIELELRKEFQKDLADKRMAYDLLRIDYDSLKKIHEETIKIKEQQINDLNLMLKEEMKPNHTEWWVLGGVTIGILLSVAVFYASVEIAK